MSAAKLLRIIQDASASFLRQNDSVELVWMLQPKQPYEVICHGDVAQTMWRYRVMVVGAFDFYTTHPAPPI